MTNAKIDDVIYGTTPIECRYAGIHPRIHFCEADLAALRPKLKREPWKTFLAETRECAGTSSPYMAFMFALTRERKWLQKASKAIKAYLDKPDTAFCRIYDMSLCYDWLFHDLQPALRKRLQHYLNTKARSEYEEFAKHEVYHSGVYGWNIASEVFGNIAAAGFALYGDVPKVAPWLRFIAEHARVITQALGPDGVSPEGICYGGFFTDTYVKMLDSVQRLMGVDLFAGNAYLQNLPWFYAFSSLPPKRMVHNNSILCFGDGALGHWVGPATYLHKIAAYYRDPLAQWVAARYRAAGASTKQSSLFSMLWHDPAVPARPATKLPLARHFTDKDMVFMRSDWKGDETIVAFKCGPHAGHHALRNYPQCVGGGHMAADAGTLLVYAHGERMISDGGYAKKYTSYRNTVLVNGKGQTGECDGELDWFECSDLRREKRGPRLLRADFSASMDYLIGDATLAYGPEAGLKQYLRHLLYLRPGTVVIVDELTAGKPSTFELFFHAYAQPGGKPEHPFRAVAPNAWDSASPNGHCRITRLYPTDAVVTAGTQKITCVAGHGEFDIDVLRLRNATPAKSALFVTVTDVFAGREYQSLPELVKKGNAFLLKVKTGSVLRTLRLMPGQKGRIAQVVGGRL